MKTELLIIKNNSDYVRVGKDEYLFCAIDKASVFSLDKISSVREYVRTLKNKGFNETCVYKLTLTETPFDLE